MSIQNKNAGKNVEESHEATHKDNHEHIHIHGPHCNHHHEPLRPLLRETPKVGRNDLCLCGSQKKYKKCCGQ